VASIEERLSREDWDPVPGDHLIGEIVAISVRVGKSEKPYPVLVIRDDDGTEYSVSCALFANDVIAHRPETGERVGVRFHGPQPRADGDGTWDKYAVAFEKETTAEVDWSAMAAARGLSTSNGHIRQAAPPLPPEPADDPWSSDAEPAF
jgi:hypothetical protein